jgi:hypothetical protein
MVSWRLVEVDQVCKWWRIAYFYDTVELVYNIMKRTEYFVLL